MRLFGRVVLICLAVIGGLTLALFAIGVTAVSSHHAKPLPKQMTLALDLGAGLQETRPESPFAKLEGGGYTVREVVETLDRASRDPHVNTLVASLSGEHLGMAQAQELRDAVAAFRKSGKRTVVYSSGMGEGAAATADYYLASAFEEIWLQPSGDLGITGFMAESPFLKDLFDKLGVQAQFGARWEYKSAIEMFTQKKFSKENRDSLTQLLNAWSDQAVAGIAEGRGLTPDQVRRAIDNAPMLAEDALKAKLVDKLAYWDEMEKSLTQKGAEIVDLEDYAAQAKPEPNAVKVALIYGVGEVVEHDPDNSPFGGGNVFAADRVTQAFRDAVKDPEVKAILFRIDSPGGSYTAADAVWREVGQARAAGKPVVVSMGNLAASGGYFAAMPADRIIAQPGTITGSIGVFSGKFVLSGLWDKLGVGWDEVHLGQNAPMSSSNQPFSPQAWERLNKMLDAIYADFTGKAMQARHIAPEQMDKLARGRIWPGSLAQKAGLVDELGGYATAMADIRTLAKLPSQMPLRLITFPKPRPALEVLMEMLDDGKVPQEVAVSLSAGRELHQAATLLRPLTRAVSAPKGALQMPPVEVK